MKPNHRHALQYTGWALFALLSVGLTLAWASSAGPSVRPVACCLLLALVVGCIGRDVGRALWGAYRVRCSLSTVAEMFILGGFVVAVVLAVRSGLSAIL